MWRVRRSVLVSVLVLFPSTVFAGNGVVALQTADPSCPDDSGNRYVDCNNGTVTDNDTGLVWLQNANCAGELDWFEARDFAAGLSDLQDLLLDCGLTDNSSPGEWRLPSGLELYEMFTSNPTGTPTDCDPALSNDAGNDCWMEGVDSFTGVESGNYWSPSPDTTDPAKAYFGFTYGGGGVASIARTESLAFYVWPVRGGQ